MMIGVLMPSVLVILVAPTPAVWVILVVMVTPAVWVILVSDNDRRMLSWLLHNLS
jgi:hypothetical protein